MKVCAEFSSQDAALESHQALVEKGIPPEAIDVRSPYPLAEEALPPHRSHPMKMRNWVRFFWVAGAIAGFSFIAYTQLTWPIHTGGHPLVSLPINFILTYECGMITGLVMTMVFFYWETRRYRNLNPPVEEDQPLERGNLVLVVEGASAEKAEKILKEKGALSVTKLSLLLFLLSLTFLSGCTVKMRDEPYIKSTEAPQISTPEGALSMPTPKEQTSHSVKSLSLLYPPQMRQLDKKKIVVPEAWKNLKNPIPPDAASVARGKIAFEHNCIFCHGAEGRGNGKVGEVFQPTPANLLSEKVRKASDGEIFYLITVGPSTMPSFANRLTPKERFDLIHYIRFLQEKYK